MKKILFAFILLLSTGALAQTTGYIPYKDSVDGGIIFNGPVTFDDLNGEVTFSWMIHAGEYKPSDRVTDYLQNYIRDYSFVVFLGTWCDDSHILIPRFERVLQAVNYPLAKVTMYGVDRAKTTKNGEEKKYAITLVPTIIVMKDGMEMGRITESVKKTIEDDLAAIITFPPAK